MPVISRKPLYVIQILFKIPCRAALVLRYAQTSNGDVGVVSKTKPVDAISSFELSRSHQRGFVIARHHGAVNGALNAVAFDRNSDLLRHGLSRTGGFVYRRVRLAAPAVHLKRLRTKSAHDEVPVAVRRAVKVTLPISSQIVAGNHKTVRVRVTVQVHVLGLFEGRFDRVVAG